MPNILYPPPRPQSVGEILDSAFRIFGATLVTCLPLAILAVILRQLPTLYAVVFLRSLTVAVWRDPVWWVLYLVAVLAAIVVTAAILLRQYAVATGHQPSAGSELGTGLRRLPGLVLYMILFSLGLVVSMIPLGLAALFSGWTRIAVGVLALLPACCFLLAVSSSWPLMMVADMGALASLNESARLTRGSWMRLTLIYTVALALLLVLYTLSGVIAALFVAVAGRADLVMMTAVGGVVMIIIGALGVPLYGALMLAVLGDLLVRREGADLAQRIATPASP